MPNLDIAENVLVLIAGLPVGVAERIVAWRWLRADTRARQARFAPWAALSLLLPVLGVAAYLPFRPGGRLRARPHCHAPSPADRSHCVHCQGPLIGPAAQEPVFLSWKLPPQAAIPLAAIAAIAVSILTAGLWLYERLLALPVATLLTYVGVGFALSLGAISWVLVKTQRATWQDNPVAFLLVAATLAQSTLLLSSAYSALALGLMAAVLSLVAALSVSTIIHLARNEVRSSIIGLALGFIVVYGAYVFATAWFGLSQGRFLVVLLCVSPFMLATAVLSARGRLVSVPGLSGHTTFLAVAVPLWGMLLLALIASLLTSPVTRNP